MLTNTLPQREVVREKDRWDLAPIFSSDDEWEQEFSAVEALLEKAVSFEGKLGDSAESLLAALEYRDELFLRLGRLYVYAHLNEDVDTRAPGYQSLSARGVSLLTKGQAAVSYISPELMTVDEEIIRGYLKENHSLAVYLHAFEEIFLQKPYILSRNEEKILAKASESLGSSEKTFSMLNNADLTFVGMKDEGGNPVQLSHGNYVKFLENKDKQVRKNAYETMLDTYGGLKNTFASTLSGAVKAGNFSADVRGYRSARHAALSSNFIPESVYDSLIEAVNVKLPSLHRYVNLRGKALGLDEINMYDMYLPMVEGVELEFTFEEAKETVLDGLAVLGDEYQSILKAAFDDRWIDHVESEGKRSGAYSSGTYNTNPYILMNWQSNLDNLYTLAHELGHSVHSYYTRKNQPYVYGNYSIFLAEIASTTNENLLTEYLLDKYDDPKIQNYIINHYLDGFKGTVFRQTQFAEFEHLIYTADQQGTPLTAEFLSEQYEGINQKYYGPTVSYDDRIALEWARIPHFYYDYYVYQYATGFSAASTFSSRILRGGQPEIDRYIGYLKAGSSDFPIEVLKKAGLDMTTNQPVKDALDGFDRRLNQLEGLIIG